MKNANKKNIAVGQHDLVVAFAKANNQKVTFFCTALHHDCNFILRTFTHGSEALKNFFYKLTGKEVAIATEAECKKTIGKCFKAAIIQSPKRKEYVDLDKILEVYTTIPSCCSCNNSKKPVNDLKITKGGNNARQASADHP